MTVVSTTMVFLECASCGVCHAIPKSMHEKCMREGGFWHCPNGHSRGWGTGTIQAERDRLRQKVAELEDAVAENAKLAMAAEKKAKKEKKQRVKLEKRASAGVCPCCNRQFVNMALHMKTKHPERAHPNLNVVVPMKKVAE